MSEGWKSIELGDYVDIISSKRIFAADYQSSGIPFYRSKEIIDKAHGHYVEDELFISHERFNAIKEKHGAPKRGELLLSAVGNRSGIPYSIKEEYDFYFKDGNLIWLRNFSSELSSQFLEYFLKSRTGQYKLKAVMIGSAQKALTIVGVKTIDFLLPPLFVQETIVSNIRTLDQKIHLLRQQNATLEAMAQALFKSWFVDFDPVIDNALAAGRELPEALAVRVAKRRAVLDSGEYPALPAEVRRLFPDGFVFSEALGRWVPEGWEVSPVQSFAKVVGGGTPSRKVDEYFTENGIPWLSPKDLSGYEWKYISGGANDITEAGLQNSSAKILPIGTVLFSSRAPIGYIAIALNELCTNQGFKSLIPYHNEATDYLYQYLKKYTPDLEAIATGSTFKEVSGGALKAFKILMPPNDVLASFSDTVGDWNVKLAGLQDEVATLTRLRDVLLPELISGRVKV